MRFRRNLAVVIGIDTYGDGISPLHSAVLDARAIAEALRRDHDFEVRCLFDNEARLSQLSTLLREDLPAGLGPDDRLLFYFAGHGIAVDGDAGPAGYLMPADARRNEHDSFLSMRWLHGELTRLPVQHAFVILDCCFAGTFRWSSLRDVSGDAVKIYRERYDRYLESAAWQVLTSASGEELALDMLADSRGEGGGGHSPFARALLDGLAGAADYTKDGVITADELALYVREHVVEAAELVGRRQVPQLFLLAPHDFGQFVFKVPDRMLALDAAPPLDDGANPYRGLQAFTEQDRELFFGRDAVTRRLIEAVTSQPLTVVVGPSGSGKSSLVQAGLVPALRADGWMILPVQRPGGEPVMALDAWLRALDAEAVAVPPVASPVTSLAASLVTTAIERLRAAPDRRWLVIVDQLEELLTHRTAEPDRAAFLAALASFLRAAPVLRVVVTVRSDAEPQFHDTALRPWWAAGRFAASAMDRSELRDAIEKPALAGVLHFEPHRLVDRLLDDVALVPAPLPLLSFALSELYRRCWARWQRGERDRALREADYDDMGSVARALTQRATDLHDQLVAEDPACAVTIRNLFVRMVAVVGGELARRRVPRDEILYENPAENRRVDYVLQRFHDARLLSLGTEHGAEDASPYVEPTHDEMVRGWTKVSEWLDDLDAAGMRAVLAALASAVRSWWADEHKGLYLWSDPRAELLRGIEHGRPFVLNAREAAFVRASVRQRRRRRVRMIAGVLTVMVVLTAAAGVALWQRGNAVASAAEADHERAIAEQQTREANRQRATAEQQTHEANRQRATAEQQTHEANRQRATAEQQLHEANRQRAIAGQQTREANRLLGMTYLERGRSLLLADHPMQALPYFVEARASSIDGSVVRMLFAQAAISAPTVALIGHKSVVRAAAFSRDGSRVVTASEDGTARVWDAATGMPVSAPLEHRGTVRAAAFSPDGARVGDGERGWYGPGVGRCERQTSHAAARASQGCDGGSIQSGR